MSLSTRMSENGSVMTINMPQRFDFTIHYDLRRAYEENQKLRNFIIDLGDTSYMDSSALGMLLQLKEHVSDADNGVKLINAKPNIKEILKIANFDKLMVIE